ncbi:MAG: hypothetical protein PHT60_13170 [Acidiphilium sp.]|nr:hypothetical protein [Acidiphilium sp.]MDD4936713.1 hypothetical protein [Acidiphilium sp.]
MIRMFAALALIPVVANGAQFGEKAVIYNADMRPVTLFAAGATTATACGLRSRRWNALIQGTTVMEAYSLAGNLWGMRGKNLSPAALVHFESMGDHLQRIRLAMENPKPDECSNLRHNHLIMPPLDNLAKMVGWSGN